jgi:hypothetical protein
MAKKLDDNLKEINSIFLQIAKLEDRIHVTEIENAYLLRHNASLDYENIHLQQLVDKLVENSSLPNLQTSVRRSVKRKSNVIFEVNEKAKLKKIKKESK